MQNEYQSESCESIAFAGNIRFVFGNWYAILIDHDLASVCWMIGIAILQIVVAGITHAVGVILNKHIMQGVLIDWHVVVAASLFVLSWFYIVSVTWIFALLVLCTGIIRGAICIQAIKNSLKADCALVSDFIHCIW